MNRLPLPFPGADPLKTRDTGTTDPIPQRAFAEGSALQETKPAQSFQVRPRRAAGRKINYIGDFLRSNPVAAFLEKCEEDSLFQHVVAIHVSIRTYIASARIKN
jgi:hypothetical protein